jgi:hypothetical protein
MNETLQLTRPARPVVETPFGLRRVLLDSGYGLSAFFIAIPALIVVAVGLALGLGLLVLLAGFLILLVTMYVARGFAHAERFRLRTMKGFDEPAPTYVVAPEGAGPLRRALTTLRDPQAWLDVVWALTGWITATVAFSVTLVWWAAAAGGLSYWYWQRFIDFGPDNMTLAELLDLGEGRTPELWLNLAIGVFALITLPLATRLVAALHAGFARMLLTSRG